MASSDSENGSQGQSGRKRQRQSATGRNGQDSEEAKKARGRPRVEAQDETAADRRRTQIRLAQRAYRQRKETTISSLKKQVTELHNAIDEMSNVFLKFHDRAIRSGVASQNPDFGRDLNSTLERFTAVARSATRATDGSDGEENAEEELAPQSPTKKSKTSGLLPLPSVASHIPQTSTDPQFAGVMPLGYQVRQQESGSAGSSSEGTSEEANSGEYLPTVPMRDANLLLSRFADPTSSNFLPWMNELAPIQGGSGAQPSQYDALFSAQHPIADPLGQAAPFDASTTLTLLDGPFANATFTEPESIGSLNPTGFDTIASMSARFGLPYTFSFQETTFSRRLNRAAVERAFHLISQSELRPHRFNNVFRLSLMYATRDEVRARLKDVLSKTASESLDSCGGPFLHLGGAGTHYPRKDPQGNVVEKPTCFTERRIGPVRTLVERHNQANNLDLATCFLQSNTDNWAVLEGYEGEWFDADDVSGYLEERGVTIPAQASFVEGEMEEPQDSTAVSAGTEAEELDPAPLEFSNIFSPSAATLASMAAGNEPAVETDSFAISDIFCSIGCGANKQKPAGTDYFNFPAHDDGSSDATIRPSDFVGSAWFDQPPAATADDKSSPSLTSGTSASSVDGPANDGMEWMRETPLKRKRTVTVEVAKLIDELIRRAVCIGRSPGFRRRDVDDALRASVISVF